MTWLSGKHLIWLAAGLLALCGVLHLLAWRTVRGGFTVATEPLAGLIWVLLAVDWVVLASLWVLGAGLGQRARPLLITSAIVPASVAIGLVITEGALVFPIYLQLSAVILIVTGALLLH
jgi:hypothetical protein